MIDFQNRIESNPQNDKRNLIFLSILFIFIATGVASLFGVRHVNDSHRYLDYATNLTDGFYVERHNFWYIGYVGFIYLVRLFTNSTDSVYLIVAQYFYSWIAFIFLYKTIRLFDQTGFSPLIGALLYFVLIEIVIWNAYILCESFYFNSITIALYYLTVLWQQKTYRVSRVLVAFFAVLIVTFSKPTGVLFLLALAITFFIGFWIRSKYSRLVKTGIAFLSVCFSVLMLEQVLESFLIIENYQLGEIIYAITTLPPDSAYARLVVPVPGYLRILPDTYSQLIRLGHFMVFNFGFWSELFLKKVFYFIFHIRPFWSLQHNVFSLLVTSPLLGLGSNRLIL